MSSIITKRGDDGYTDRLYNRRTRKDSLLVEAIGCIDELNASLGVANGMGGYDVTHIQHVLVQIMGELNAGWDHWDRYQKQFPRFVTGQDVADLEALTKSLEYNRKLDDWATPSTRWDVACRVCRRAERAVLRLHFADPIADLGELVREEVRLYLNRLSDYLWILGRGKGQS